MDGEPCLQASQPRWRLREAFGGCSDLLGRGDIFGIENHDKLPAQQWQGDIEGAWLGPQSAVRRYDDLLHRASDAPGQRLACCRVIFLDHEFDIELGRRIVAVLGSNLTKPIRQNT